MQLITSHLNTDFDSLACMIAAQKLYPDAVICPPGAMSRKVRDFMAHHGLNWKLLKPKKVPLDQITLMVVVDTRSRQRIGPFAALAGRQDVKVHIYDHHPATINDIPAEKLCYEPLGAAVTMLVEELRQRRKSITPEEATLFALGIYDDTGALTYEATTDRDIEAMAYLRNIGADLSRVLSRVEVSVSAQDLALLDVLAENARECYINGAKVLLTWAETAEYVDGLSLFVHRLRDYCDSHVTIAVVNNGGKKVNIIARSAPDVLNVKEFLAPYGGSGHLQAGSATFAVPEGGCDVRKLLDEIEEKLKTAIPPMLLVSDIMTSPVIAVPPEAHVDEGYRTMLRFGLKALPVVNNSGEVVGMMTRKDLDKAHLHGLDRAQISDFMTEGVISLASAASIDEAHRMMATYGFEKMPVMDAGRLVGMLTRADLVKALYRSGQFASSGSSHDSGFLWMESVAYLMEESFPEKTLNLLRRVGTKAQEMGMRAYLVGGTVRDILMGVKNTDIDISVEGDAEKLVAAWDEPGCKSTLHGRYKTGTITFPDGEKVDVATARREFYEYAAATPTVQSDSLKQDLGRRDFTVNAMSISLSDDDWGTLVDNFGGRADLKDGALKILHNLSFVEDPSRVLRGIRLEQRLNMHFEDNTLRLLHSAVRGGLLECLSSPRIRTELEIMAKEACFRKIILRMCDLGIWESLFPGIHIDDMLGHRLRLLEHLLAQAHQHNIDFKGMEWLVSIAVVFADSSTQVRFAGMDRMNLTPNERKEITQCFTTWPQVEKFCYSNKKIKNSEIYLFFKDFGPVPLLYWMTCLKSVQARRLIAEHLYAFKDIKCSLTGHDLQNMGLSGRDVGQALNALKLALMDGDISSRVDEIDYVSLVFADSINNKNKK
ncbi:MAG: CBS domain-containing protein [Synergistaceae bacterium]|nr:CBS domain-containing protein [Synergistaceae bacterium]